jgi:hypothetical protein
VGGSAALGSVITTTGLASRAGRRILISDINLRGQPGTGPLAAAILGGVLTWALLGLLVIPALYLPFGEPRRESAARGAGSAFAPPRSPRLARLLGNRASSVTHDSAEPAGTSSRPPATALPSGSTS